MSDPKWLKEDKGLGEAGEDTTDFASAVMRYLALRRAHVHIDACHALLREGLGEGCAWDKQVEAFLSCQEPPGDKMPAAKPGPVKIVLGGPWDYDGKRWEHWRDGRYYAAWRIGTKVRVRDGHYEHKRSGEDVWQKSTFSRKAQPGDELRAPKNYKPTPDTLPEGCYIATPEGVERLCETCAWSQKPEFICVRVKCLTGGCRPKWCPEGDGPSA